MPNEQSLESILLQDVIEPIKGWPLAGAGRRALIRAIFAAIEGHQWGIQFALAEAASPRLTPAEMAFLRDERSMVSDSGEVRTESARLTLKQRIKLTAKVLAKIDAGFSANYTDPGWQCLIASLDVRDRLTHPKRVADMEVSENEAKDALFGLTWFLMNISTRAQVGMVAFRETDEGRRKMLVEALRRYSEPPSRRKTD